MTGTNSPASRQKYSARFVFRNATERASSSRPFMPSSTEIEPDEADAGEDAEDGVVVVQSLAGLAVPQLVGVADGAVRLRRSSSVVPGRDSGPRRASSRRGA